jgi:hypothetical protein
VRRRRVERVEVVVHGLHLGPLGDIEAEADEHVLDLAPCPREQVQAPEVSRRVGRERHVDAVGAQTGVELGGGETLGTSGDRLLETLTRPVGRLAGGRALLDGQLGDRAQQIGQLGLAPEVPDAHVLQRGGVAGPADRCARLGLDRLDRLDPLSDAHARAILRDVSYRATVAAIAALSEWVAIGI